jgi:hypothetical protein
MSETDLKQYLEDMGLNMKGFDKKGEIILIDENISRKQLKQLDELMCCHVYAYMGNDGLLRVGNGRKYVV